MSVEVTKVLLIEHNPADVRLIREMLTDAQSVPLDIECVDRLSSGLVCLAAQDIDVVFLDLSLPDSQGLDTFRKVYTEASGTPIVVLTGSGDELVRPLCEGWCASFFCVFDKDGGDKSEELSLIGEH